MSFTSRQSIRDASRPPLARSRPPRRLGCVTRVPPSLSHLGRVCPPCRLGHVRPAPSSSRSHRLACTPLLSLTPLTCTPLVSVARAPLSWTIEHSYILST